ncbi:MAG: alpha/beta fold hydrolase [Oscillospiraceae bacterium]|nr:alpha/beta fold hydrolase [Oscillospiraceae bacterium]
MNPKYHDIICARAGADTAVILLHGILSAPQFFDFLLPEIPEHVSVYGILLEGHGEKPEALAETSMQRWKRQVHMLMQKLLPRYPNIVIAAHSMGTLFALQLAAEYPEKIAHMLLLGVLLRVHLTPFGAECSLLAACGMHSQNPKLSAMQHAYSILPDCNPLHYAGWIARYRELFDEIDAVNEMRMQVRVPCTVYQSAADELVSPDALPLLDEMPSVRLHVLRQSSHLYFPPQDQERILYAWRKIIRKTTDHGGQTRP